MSIWRRWKNRHIHDWNYHPRTISGWGICICRSCGEREIY